MGSASLMQTNDADDESDSSDEDSAEESDSEAEDDKDTKTAPTASSSAPMTASRHAELLAQLTSFVKGPAEDVEVDGVGYITEDSDEGELEEDMMDEGEVDIVMDGQAVDLNALRELMNAKKREEEMPTTTTMTTTTSQGKPKQEQADTSSSSDSSSSDSDSSDSDEESSALPARLAQVEMLSDYEEEEETPSGPLKTEHEILEEPVQVPPFQRLGQGARVILAGEVVSFIKDPGLGVWEQWQRAQKLKEEEEASVKQEEGEKVGVEEETKVEEAVDAVVKSEEESGQISETVEPVAQPGQVEVEVKVEVSETLLTDVNAATPAKEESVNSTTITAAQPEPPAEQKPLIASDAQAPTTTTTNKRARNRAGKRRPNDAGKGKQSGKPNGPPAPKSSGTVVVQALRPPAGTVKGGTDRLDEDGWLLDGSVICTGEGEAVAVVSTRGDAWLGFPIGVSVADWPSTCRFRSQKCLVRQHNHSTC
ncbi:hypothetical protein QFC22_003473 [Naganishia vaughanmartiniae]|uniref:Uncharacterized protein n=1 Tax=Naganishia vaughanmartiniae TaxID=1424756 RepID=A0ACC2X835_9TREE|nr:hypothetical protein QFC22_003473 [Naganishia vaughanmartiniae]